MYSIFVKNIRKITLSFQFIVVVGVGGCWGFNAEPCTWYVNALLTTYILSLQLFFNQKNWLQR